MSTDIYIGKHLIKITKIDALQYALVVCKGKQCYEIDGAIEELREGLIDAGYSKAFIGKVLYEILNKGLI